MKDYKGLYILKEENPTWILKNGRDATTTKDGNGTKTIYFLADDGIYQYNPDKNTAEKYDTIKDNLIAITKKKQFFSFEMDSFCLTKIKEVLRNL